MCVCGLYTQVGLELAVLHVEECAQKYDFLRLPGGGEFNLYVVRV